MKNIQLKTLFLLFTVLLISCEDRLEVFPEDELSSSIVFNNEVTITGAINGMYSKLQDGDIFGEPQMVADFMSDNVNFVGSFPTLNDINQFETLANNATLRDFWIDQYETISVANLIINKLETIDASILEPDTRSLFIAEAKFVRALIFFELVNQWAQPFQFQSGNNLGIPLQLDAFEGGDLTPFQLERSTVNEVHQQIINDLNDAIADLPATNSLRATKGAAQALLSRLYLYREDWSNAASLANDAISAGSLSSDFSFYDQNTTSSEHLFIIVNTAADNTVGSGFTTYYNAAPGGRGDAPFSQNLIDAFASEPNDKRFSDLSVAATDAGGNSTYFTTKYPDVVNDASLVPVLRITEMYLIRAEANLRAGSMIGDSPINDINALRLRAGLNALSSVDLDAILLERRKELCFEGHRRMDLLRNNQNLRPEGGSVSALGANKIIFPIPEREIQNNPNITQNPGSF